MPTQHHRASRSLPESPDLRHLKNQAKDLLKAGKAASLADAQFKLAREYGFASWPKLKAHVESMARPSLGSLERAIQDEDTDTLSALIARDAGLLHRDGDWALSKSHNHHKPLSYAAGKGKLKAVRFLLDAGAHVDHLALIAASYHDGNVPTMELFLHHGADVNAVSKTPSGERYSIIFGPCQTLAPKMRMRATEP